MVGQLFGGGPAASQSPAYTGLDVQTSVLGVAIPVLIGKDRVVPNVIWYGDFKTIKQKQGGKGGGGGKSGGVSYSYSASLELALCEGQLSSIGTVWRAKGITSLSALGMTLLNGSQTSAWSWLTAKHPSDAFVYPNTAIVAVSNLQLGNTPTIGNFAFEAASNDAAAYGGEVDLDIASICEIVLSHTRRGVGFTTLASFTAAKDYCKSLGLIGSLYQREQQAVREVLTRLAKSANLEFLWSDGTLKLIPQGDSDVSGNGFSWSAPASPLYALGETDFQSPVAPERTRAADVKNVIKVEWKDRANQYNVTPAEYKDEASISQIGLKQPVVVQAHHFKKSAPAMLSAQFEAARYTRRNSYRVPLDARYSHLEPLDFVTLTDTLAELSAAPVRIEKVTIAPDGSVTLMAKERQAGTGDAAAYTFDPGVRAAEDFNAAAPNVVAPYIFEPPSVLTDGRREVWIAVAGLGNWGGCEVWVSDDNATYRFLERIEGPGRYGALSTSLPSAASPDSSNTPRVNLTAVEGELTSTTTAGAQALNTLAMIDNELIAYRDATLVSANIYDLGYLIRGARGTAVAAHSSSAPFVRLDENIVKFEFDETRVGDTVYFKFVSFNATEGGRQDISAVTAYSKVLGGASYWETRNELLPDGNTNLVHKSEFEKGAGRWSYYDPDSFTGKTLAVLTTGGKKVLKLSATSPGASKTIGLYQVVADAFPCVANQKLACRDEYEATGAINYVYAALWFYNSSDSLVTTATVELKTGTASLGAALAKADFVVPNNTAITKAVVAIFANCSSGAMTLSLTRPQVNPRVSDTAAIPAYAPGPNADDAADVTASNTAAAIAGQGPLATESVPTYAGNAAAFAALGAGHLYRDSTDSNKAKTSYDPGLADLALYVQTPLFLSGANINGTSWIQINGVTTPALTGKTSVTCVLALAAPKTGDTMPTNGTMALNWRVKSGSDVIATGTMTILQSPGDPPEVTAMSTPAGSPVPLSSTAAQNLVIELQRVSGPADLDIYGSARARYE